MQGFNSLLSERKPEDNVRPIFLEVCAGSAILSFFVETISKGGTQVVPIDNDANRHKPKVPVLKLDLLQSSQVQIIISLIKSGNVGAAHLAPPCGTCSRAREIPLPGGKGPRPLRSDDFPLGLDGLTEAENNRVQCASLVYEAVFDIVDELILILAAIGLENPDRSIFWLLPRALILLSKGFSDSRFQHCKWTMSIPMRPKWVRVRANRIAFHCIAGECSADHVHLKWGQTESGEFKTAFDAECPPEMAAVLADIYLTEMVLAGFSNARPQSTVGALQAPLGKRIRASAVSQPRGKSIASLVSEFKEVIYCKRSAVSDNGHKILKSSVPSLSLLEKGIQVDATVTTSSVENSETPQVELPDDMLTVGVFRDPIEFLTEAEKLKHPVDTFLNQSLPIEMLQSLAANLRHAPSSVISHRVAAIRSLIKLLKDEEKSDEKVIAAMDPFMNRTMKGKKLHTLGLLLAKWNFPDVNLATDLSAGFKLTGMQPFSKLFRHEIRVPETTEVSLRANSTLNNKLNLVRTKSSGDEALDKSFYDQALEEESKGWLVGPFESVHDYSAVFSHEPHLSRRFPLQQREKVRSIDDLLESGTNTTYGCHDKLFLHGVDFIAQSIKTIESVLSKNKSIVADSGEVVVFAIDKSWNSLINKWSGKTIDLAEAYKQCSTHPDSRWCSAVTVYNPSKGRPDIFGQITLPFGASAAVLAFNRASRALYFLGCKELWLVWSAFFDDFTSLSPQAIEESAFTAAVLLFKLLGWKVSEKEGKNKPWSELFVTLGVVFDISKISESLSTVSNKPDRVLDMQLILAECLKSKHASAKQCESVKGKLSYADSQVFGRASKGKIRVFDRKNGSGKQFTPEDCVALRWLHDWLSISIPRPITSKYSGPPLLLFTDGACEYVLKDLVNSALVTCGAVLLDRRDMSALVFGLEICHQLSDSWRVDSGKEQLVTEAELFPQLLARLEWRDRLINSNLICFVDSEPAKFSLIRGTSEAPTCADIVYAVSQLDAQLSIWAWYTRVPSFSNLADDPSRLEIPKSIRNYKLLVSSPKQPISLKHGTINFG